MRTWEEGECWPDQAGWQRRAGCLGLAQLQDFWGLCPGGAGLHLRIWISVVAFFFSVQEYVCVKYGTLTLSS